MKESDLDTVVKDPRLTAKAVGASTNVYLCFQLQPVSMRSSTPLHLSAHAMIFRTNNIPINCVDYFSLIIVAVFPRGSSLILSECLDDIEDSKSNELFTYGCNHD